MRNGYPTSSGRRSGGAGRDRGRADVTKTLVSGRYLCSGLTSHDPATGKLGKVDVEIAFTAKT
jgi:hypothetical protein